MTTILASAIATMSNLKEDHAMNRPEITGQRVCEPSVVQGDTPNKPDKDVDQLKSDMERAADHGDARLRDAEHSAGDDTAAVRPDRSGNDAAQ